MRKARGAELHCILGLSWQSCEGERLPFNLAGHWSGVSGILIDRSSEVGDQTS